MKGHGLKDHNRWAALRISANQAALNSTAQDLSILLSLYYTLLVCGVLAILVTLATVSINCVAVMSSSSQHAGASDRISMISLFFRHI